MAQVLVRLKVLPDDVSINLDELSSNIGLHLPKDVKLRSSKKEPIAFGLSALIMDLLVDEKEGAMDELEQYIGKVEHVSQVDVLGVSRLSTKLK
jgi:elongation factor 1-beta